MDSVRSAIEYHPHFDGLSIDYQSLGDRTPASMVRLLFVEICGRMDKPIVVFFDEADCLSNGTLIAFLRQLRDGYVNRVRTPFIHSLALVGMRNIRDYKADLRNDSATLGSASPFNIVTESLTLRNFTREGIAEL
jgi:hypothetical protein